MARPQKTGLDYFPVDTTWERNMFIVKAKYQLVGIGCIIELYSAIYREGYFLPWDADTKALFMAANGIDENTLDGIIDLSTSKGIFDARSLAEKGVLTSRGIQKRWIQAVKGTRRNIQDIDSAINLLSESESLDISSELPSEDMHPFMGLSSAETPHIVLNNIKEKDIVLGEYANISLSEAERDRLVSELGQDFFNRLITFYSAWKQEKKPKTKDDNLTIRRWVIDAMRERDAKHPPASKPIPTRPDAKSSEEIAQYRRDAEDKRPPTLEELAELEELKRKAFSMTHGAARLLQAVMPNST
jgi:hypothetical protein